MSGVVALVVSVVVPLGLGLLAARWGSDTRDPRWSVWDRDGRTPVRQVVPAGRDGTVRVHRSHGAAASARVVPAGALSAGASSAGGPANGRRPSLTRHAH